MKLYNFKGTILLFGIIHFTNEYKKAIKRIKLICGIRMSSASLIFNCDKNFES